MSDLRYFTVPGHPSPKARARVTRSGRAYTPKPTQLAEGKVLECYLADWRGLDPIVGPVSINIIAAFAVPPSWSRKKREAADYHVSRPDADNVQKLVLDALNGVAFIDDSQVCELHMTKRYEANECIRVRIEALGQ